MKKFTMMMFALLALCLFAQGAQWRALGAGRQRTPLISVVAASNEVPSDEALQAFHDRFLLRVPVAPVSDAAFAALLAGLQAAGAERIAGEAAAAVAQEVVGGLHVRDPARVGPALRQNR